MHDLILEGGTLVDGTGAKPREADVAIDGGRISAVGKNLGPARRTGAKPTPQLPITTVVAPCQLDGVISGSHVAWPS